MEKRYFAAAKGKVQGVGFRFFVETNAAELGLTGWVRNMDDGSVHMEAQGAEEMLEKLFARVRQGSRFIRVDSLELRELPARAAERRFVTLY